jgi:alcohol dehydrogenase
MLSVAVTEPNNLQIVEIPKPIPGPYEARIKSEVAALCNATDRKLIEGHFPGVEDYPLLLGHETVGIVDSVGDKVRTFKVGDRVVGGLLLNSTNPAYASGWGGFSEYLLAGDHRAMVEDGVATPENGWQEVYEIMRPVTQSIPVEAAVMLCTWREVYAAFDDFSLKAGDNIVIFGAGPVGLSFIKFARLLGLGTIYCVEILPEKRQKALDMGADAVFAPEEVSTIAAKHGHSFDAIIDAVGRESIINAAIPLVKMGGSVCVYGVLDQPSIRVDNAAGPYNFNLLIHQWPTRAREYAAQDPLVEWIQAGNLSHKDFVTAEFPIQKINEGFEMSKSSQPIKTLFWF